LSKIVVSRVSDDVGSAIRYSPSR